MLGTARPNMVGRVDFPVEARGTVTHFVPHDPDGRLFQPETRIVATIPLAVRPGDTVVYHPLHDLFRLPKPKDYDA